MFCRFGSLVDRRPVAATVWLSRAWMRPVCGCTSSGTVNDDLDMSNNDPDGNGSLFNGSSGSVTILWKESGTGENKWAVVRLAAR